jgi:hypothetical protein
LADDGVVIVAVPLPLEAEKPLTVAAIDPGCQTAVKPDGVPTVYEKLILTVLLVLAEAGIEVIFIVGVALLITVLFGAVADEVLLPVPVTLNV